MKTKIMWAVFTPGGRFENCFERRKDAIWDMGIYGGKTWKDYERQGWTVRKVRVTEVMEVVE